MKSYRLNLNDETVGVEAPPDMPLLWVLRDFLGLTGTKYGCGMGVCGACTVHLDGQAVRACMLPVEAVGEAEVTTIEHLGLKDARHPLQQAWREHDVPQCGFCQPGQLMTAAALLNRQPDADRATIRQALASNLCRCGTYQRIEDAVYTVSTHKSAQGGDA